MVTIKWAGGQNCTTKEVLVGERVNVKHISKYCMYKYIQNALINNTYIIAFIIAFIIYQVAVLTCKMYNCFHLCFHKIYICIYTHLYHRSPVILITAFILFAFIGVSNSNAPHMLFICRNIFKCKNRQKLPSYIMSLCIARNQHSAHSHTKSYL